MRLAGRLFTVNSRGEDLLVYNGTTGVLRVNGTKTDESRKLLVERVAASRYISKSARLRDLLLYLCERVREGSAGEIHEQEVGHKVFGRPPDYDTGSDNIVRVHASMLRKRLEQYFAREGADEPLIIEIPKGNYAPVFRERREFEPVSSVAEPVVAPAARPGGDRGILALSIAATVFAVSTAVLLIRGGAPADVAPEHLGPTVRMFWSQVFRGAQNTDLVVDDAAFGLYQELAGRNLALSDYYDRSYLRTVPEAAQVARLDEATASSLVLRRQSSYSNVTFLWKLFRLSGADARRITLVFARDYSFRELRSRNAILLGTPRSNPWIEPFLPRVGLRWLFDKATGAYYPVDTWAGAEPRVFRGAEASEVPEGYGAISLLPNLSSTGNVLIVSATGGSAFNAAADFLADEAAMSALRKSLPPAKDNAFPYFEALVRVKGRSSLPRDAVVAISRPAR
jgi:hypothetical protein